MPDRLVKSSKGWPDLPVPPSEVHWGLTLWRDCCTAALDPFSTGILSKKRITCLPWLPPCLLQPTGSQRYLKMRQQDPVTLPPHGYAGDATTGSLDMSNSRLRWRCDNRIPWHAHLTATLEMRWLDPVTRPPHGYAGDATTVSSDTPTSPLRWRCNNRVQCDTNLTDTLGLRWPDVTT